MNNNILQPNNIKINEKKKVKKKLNIYKSKGNDILEINEPEPWNYHLDTYNYYKEQNKKLYILHLLRNNKHYFKS